MAVEKEGFASRWSRRKQEVANETAVEELPETIEGSGETVAVEVDEETLAEQRLEKLNALTDEDMPDIETLNEDSDFSGFMSTGVSETLRKMALQKLFHGKSYNVRDGLDEYDGDYTSFEKLDPSVITCDMKHLLEVEAEKLRLAEEEKAKEELLLAEAGDDIEVAEIDSELETEQQEFEGQDETEDMVEAVAEIDEMELDELDDVEGEDV
jgi:hypothetical protein